MRAHALSMKPRPTLVPRMSLTADAVTHASALWAVADSALDMPSATLDMPTIVEKAATLDALGKDVLVFLGASVLVVPLSRAVGVTPVLGFLAIGCAIGPYGLELFSNTEADLELGDFGILFLLFVEGLNLSPEKLKGLGAFFRLGASQLLLSIALFFFGAPSPPYKPTSAQPVQHPEQP